jgi:hypothetical protein
MGEEIKRILRANKKTLLMAEDLMLPLYVFHPSVPVRKTDLGRNLFYYYGKAVQFLGILPNEIIIQKVQASCKDY